jgi:hypothetical protein
LGATFPAVAFDGAGNAVMAWSQSDGVRFNLWASRYDTAAGWGTPTLIESDDAGGVRNPQVAFDGLGNSFVVWEHSDGTRYNIWANHHSADWGWGRWGTPELLEVNDTGNAINVQLASNGAGNLIAAWQQFDGLQNRIFANRYSAASGWSGAELVETNDTASARSPQVALAPSGDAFVLWAQTGAYTDHWANRYEAGVGWGNATMVQQSSGPGNDTAGYDVAALPGGKALAVWSQATATTEDIWSSVFTPGSGWSGAQTIESNNTYGETPMLAVDGSGNAIAAWYQGTGLVGDVYANRYTAASGWGTAQPIAAAWNPVLEPVGVASNPGGDAVAVWAAPSAGHNSVVANRFTPGVGWGTPELLEFNDTYDADRPKVAVDTAGNAMVAWEQSDGVAQHIWADRFAVVDVTPPILSVSSPLEGTVTNRSAVWVGGVVEPGAKVSVNGMAAAVGDDGTWGLLAGLLPGPNNLVVSAEDSSGNRVEATLHIHFDDPALGVAADLEQARTRVAALEADAASMQVDLARAQADLAAAQARVAAVEAEANATRADLDGAKANLASAQGHVSALEMNVSQAQADLQGAFAALGEAQARSDALENQSNTTQADLADARAQSKAASGQAAFATILGEAGFLLAAAATLIAFRSRRTAIAEAPPKDAKPKAPPKGAEPEVPPEAPPKGAEPKALPLEPPKDAAPAEAPKSP